mgnify:CR=1 FL=1
MTEILNYQHYYEQLVSSLSSREKRMLSTLDVDGAMRPNEIISKLEQEGFATFPGGTVLMGTDKGLVSTLERRRENEMPPRYFKLPSFYVSRTLVSNHDFERFDQRRVRPGIAPYDNSPVTCISYGRAVSYVNWLNRETGLGFRLPTEPEMVAIMAPAGWEYSYQDQGEPQRRAENVSFAYPDLYPEGEKLATLPVDCKEIPSNFLGIIHPSGNLSVFTLGMYPAPGHWGALTDGMYAVVVGGNFRQCPYSARVYTRGILDVAAVGDTVGIRLVHPDPYA